MVIAKLKLQNVVDPILVLRREATIHNTTSLEHKLKWSWLTFKKKSK